MDPVFHGDGCLFELLTQSTRFLEVLEFLPEESFAGMADTPSPAAVQMVIFLEKHLSFWVQRMYHKVFLLLPSVLCRVLLSTPSGNRLGRDKVDADLAFLMVLPVQAAPWRLHLARFDRARSEISENQ